MADVFRADDAVTGTPVAVKLLRGVDPSHARRFSSEIDVLQRLEHPAIVRMCDSGEHDGVAFIVTDLVEGESLAARLGQGAIGLDATIALGEAVAMALAHAHAAGVVHRDIKPANILVDSAGRPLLADFGIARLAGSDSLTGTGNVVGTASYLAPEQVKGDRAGPEADVWALGLVLIECLTGAKAYGGPSVAAAMARLHEPPPIPGDAPEWLARLLGRMTSLDKDDRPEAATVAAALRARSATPLAVAAAASVPETQVVPVVEVDAEPTSVLSAPVPASFAPARARRPWWLAPVLLLAIVALVVGAVVASGRDASTSTGSTTTSPTVATSVAPTTTAPSTTAAPAPARDDGKGNGKGKGKGDG
jgi:serine/threonine protein kinase